MRALVVVIGLALSSAAFAQSSPDVVDDGGAVTTVDASIIVTADMSATPIEADMTMRPGAASVGLAGCSMTPHAMPGFFAVFFVAALALRRRCA